MAHGRSLVLALARNGKTRRMGCQKRMGVSGCCFSILATMLSQSYVGSGLFPFLFELLCDSVFEQLTGHIDTYQGALVWF